MNKLKTCPFCGGNTVVRPFINCRSVVCGKCGMVCVLPIGSGEDDLVEAYNQRYKEKQKVFISMPRDGKTQAEIDEDMETALVEIQINTMIDKDVEIICPVAYNEEMNPLDYLSYAIKCLSEADVAFFACGWHKDTECVIEHNCALKYGVKVVHSDATPSAEKECD